MRLLVTLLLSLLLAGPPPAHAVDGDGKKHPPAAGGDEGKKGDDGGKKDEDDAAPPPADDDLPTEDLRAGKDEHKRYLLHGPMKDAKEPKDGYRLAVILPGGPGTSEFAPFVKNILKNALGKEWLVAQPVSVRWTEDQEIVWPTKKNPVPKMRFTTEEFVEAVVAEVQKTREIDGRYVFTLSWSSSGPAAYAIALQDRTRVTGSYVSMSVFFPDRLPSLKNGRGHPFYIEHSPDDKVCLFKYAEEARDALRKAGAEVEFSTYEGGHGWTGAVYPRLRKGFDWLERKAPKRAPR